MCAGLPTILRQSGQVLELRLQGTWLAGSPTIAPVMRRACRILRVRRPDEGSAVYGRQERERSEMRSACGRASSAGGQIATASMVERPQGPGCRQVTASQQQHSKASRCETGRVECQVRARPATLRLLAFTAAALPFASASASAGQRQQCPLHPLGRASPAGKRGRRKSAGESHRAACSARRQRHPPRREVRSRWPWQWPLARRGHRRSGRADQPPARSSSAANLEATFAASPRQRRPLRARSRALLRKPAVQVAALACAAELHRMLELVARARPRSIKHTTTRRCNPSDAALPPDRPSTRHCRPRQ